ncbi:MAG: hypothetical protein LBH32_03070 [Dysgonamonadaceae bacterium]|nr:hypothetical protein [Dysgonamonadaceae bacterium]
MKNILYLFTEYKKHGIYLTITLFASLYSCSFIRQYSIYKPVAGTDNCNSFYYDCSYYPYIYNIVDFEKVNKNRQSSLYQIPNENFRIIPFHSFDSLSLYVEPFPGGKVLFSGPAFVPIIPNFRRYYGNKKEYLFHIIISHDRNDTILCNLDFFANDKKIIPESIEIIEFKNTTVEGFYSVKSVLNNDCMNLLMYPDMYYLFTFTVNKILTNNIEIQNKKKYCYE